MLKQVSLRLRLILAFLLLAGLVAGVGVFQLQSLHNANELYADMFNNDLERQSSLADIKLLYGQAEKYALEYGQFPTQHNAAKQKELIGTTEAKIDVLFDHYRQSTQADNKFAAGTEKIDTLITQSDTLIKAATAYVDAAAKQQPLNAAYKQLNDASSEANRSIDARIVTEQKAFAQEDIAVSYSVSQVVTTTLILVTGIIVIALLLGLVLSRTITHKLGKLRDEAELIANGDFSRRVSITANDELGKLAAAFNEMAERLRASYRRMAVETERDRTLLESLAEGIIAIDENQQVELANEQTMRLLGLPEHSALAGKPVADILKVADEKDAPVPVEELPFAAALREQRHKHEVYNYKRSGVTIKLDVSANPIIVNDVVSGVIMNMRDVTHEKEVDRMKTEFISLASHQLRTPLSAIKWFSEMLLSGDAGKLNPDQDEFAHNIADSTERMIALVNALLNISRIESGRIMVDPKPTDLKELVGGIVNDLKAKTDERKQTLIISVHDDLPKINLDPRLIGQVYLNLLTNAIKYTPKNGEVSVFISRKDDEIISQVTDNGYGIPKDQQDRVFQKFFRASNAVKVETDGTGLGLYLIKAVVESSGGRIWFESAEGKGTTFWFSMPITGMKPKKGEVTLDV